MQENTLKINRFLIVYLLIYLVLALKGSLFFSTELLNRITQLLPVILGIGFLVLTRQSPRKTLQLHMPHPLSILLTIPLTFCLLPSIAIVNAASMVFFENHISTTVSATVLQHGLVYSLLTFALMPACFEEFTFRGLLYGQYRQKHVGKAILLSALCFGLMHMNFNQFLYAFLLGICLAVLLEVSGSLLLPILMHATFNGTSILLVYVEQQIMTITGTVVAPTSSADAAAILGQLLHFSTIVMAVGGLLLAGVLYYFIAVLNGKKGAFKTFKKDAFSKHTKLGSPALYAFLVICVLMCIMMEFIL